MTTLTNPGTIDPTARRVPPLGGLNATVLGIELRRTLRATLRHPDEAAIRAVPGVDSVEVRGDTVIARTRDSDALARHLLTTTDARDLEITAQALEEVFLDLTGDSPEGNA